MPKINSQNGLVSYVRHYLKPILISLAFVFACYGAMLVYPDMQIDEEDWITTTDVTAKLNRWISIGRFGVAALENVLGLLKNFNTRAFDICAITLYFVSAVIFLYSVHPSKKTPPFGIFAFISIFCAVPFSVGELISFSMYNVYQGVAMLSASLALLCAVKNISFKKPGYFIGAVLLSFCATSFYQSFIIVIVAGLMAYALFSFTNGYEPAKTVVMRVIYGIIAAAVALAAYFCIYRLLVGEARLGDQRLTQNFVGWEADANNLVPLKKMLLNTARILFGRSIYGGVAICIISLLFASGGIYNLVRVRKNSWLRFLSMVLLALSPFFMSYVLGAVIMLGRTFTGLAPALASEVLFVVVTAGALGKFLKFAVYGTVSFCMAYNFLYTNYMFYAGHLVYEQDKKTAASIMDAIYAAGLDASAKPVLFIGTLNLNKYPPYNNPVTGSYFSWDGGNNRRIHNLLRVMGYDALYYDKQQFEEAYPLGSELPAWPAPGSIVDGGSCIIVKLSEPGKTWMGINGAGG